MDSPKITPGPPQDSTTDDRPSAPAAGKRPLGSSTRTSAHPVKRMKVSVPDVPMVKETVPTRSWKAASSIVPAFFDLSLSSDSEPIRAALAGFHSSRRRRP
uniref:Uncharacterized protein n=1 Tax=Peronospora matthiolae TaxID=2874970 RepID=A0AAV1U1Q4_9STRA